MATATSHEHHNNRHLPPSPPSSPHSTRRRHKKRHDSFEALANSSIPSPPSSPSHGPVTDDDQGTLLERIILTPVLLISFVLSLSLVNLRDRAKRTYAHSSTSFLTYFYPSSWLDPEPYQNPDDSRWGRRGMATHFEPNDAISPRERGQAESKTKKEKRSWHLNKKIRKVAKLEVSDAFEMRGRVIVGMVAMMALGSIALWMSVKWMLVALTSSLLGSKQ